MILRPFRSNFCVVPLFRRLRLLTICAGLMLICEGCRTLPEFPAVDLRAPGWNVREAQVLWTREAGAPPVAGELLVAIGPDGRNYAQFTKNPFQLLVAQTDARGWQLSIPPERKRYSSRGRPPAKVGLFQFSEVLRGQPPAASWNWHEPEPGAFVLERRATGERLEGRWQE
jgi:hypothetical protein